MTRSRSPGSASARASRGRSSGTTSRSGPRSHGSHNIRAPGSVGASATPSRVFKGVKMAGRMGGKRVTQLGLTVHSVDPDQNLLLVKGSIPGPKNGLVEVRGLMAAPKAPCSARKAPGQGRLARGGRVRRRDQAAPRPRGGSSRAERAARRHDGDEEPRPRLGRPLEAVAPEGHGPRPRRHDARRPVHRRRPRVREGAAVVRRQGQPQGRQGSASLGARQPHVRGSFALLDAASFEEPSTKLAKNLLETAELATPTLVVVTDDELAAAKSLPQPRARRRRGSVRGRGRRRRLGALAARQRGGASTAADEGGA